MSLGGAWASRIAPRCADPVGLLSKVLLLTGLLNLAISALLGIGPLIFFWLLSWTFSYGWTVLLLTQARVPLSAR